MSATVSILLATSHSTQRPAPIPPSPVLSTARCSPETLPRFAQIQEDRSGSIPTIPSRDVLTADDRQFIGNTSPKISGGFGLNATFKGFDLAHSSRFAARVRHDQPQQIHMSLTCRRAQRLPQHLSAEFSGMWHRYDEMGKRHVPQPRADGLLQPQRHNVESGQHDQVVLISTMVSRTKFVRASPDSTLRYSLPQVAAALFCICRSAASMPPATTSSPSPTTPDMILR